MPRLILERRSLVVHLGTSMNFTLRFLGHVPELGILRVTIPIVSVMVLDASPQKTQQVPSMWYPSQCYYVIRRQKLAHKRGRFPAIAAYAIFMSGCILRTQHWCIGTSLDRGRYIPRESSVPIFQELF